MNCHLMAARPEKLSTAMSLRWRVDGRQCMKREVNNMFNLGFPELMVILVIALIVFGPGKMPELGNSLGKAIRGFKKAMSEEEKDQTDVKKTDQK
jgi:sec-independent protein translocase protein TatA